MTNQLFSALLFSTVQYQTDMKDLHLSCSSTLALVQDWNIFSQVLPFSLLFTGRAVWEARNPDLRPLWSRLGERASTFLHADFQFLFVAWVSGVPAVFRVEEQSTVPLWTEGSLSGGPAQRAGTRSAGCRTRHPQGTVAPILPFSPAFLERAAELKLTLAQRQEMLFCWSHHRVFRTAQDPTWHLFYTQTFCGL